MSARQVIEEILAHVRIALARDSIHIQSDAAQLTFGVDGTEAIQRLAENALVLQDDNKWSRNVGTLTLGAGAVTFASVGMHMWITGDGGGNTIATITGGVPGEELTLTFVDGNVTITDTDAHGANTVDLAGAATDFVSADDTVLTLVYDGHSWYEKCRSVN